MKGRAIVRHILLAAVMTLASVPLLHGDCGATTFTPNRQHRDAVFPTIPAVHNAMYLTDPSNQQYVVVDLEAGGSIVSVRYLPGGDIHTNGTPNPNAPELIWGHDTLANVQPTMFGAGGYNPQQAGDWGVRDSVIPNSWSRGAPIYGAACKNGNYLIVYTAGTDAQQDNRGYRARAAGIDDERIGTTMWFTPYAFTSILTWVENPGTGPDFYLKVDQSITNTDSTEGADVQAQWGFTFGMALYMPRNFTNWRYYPTDHPECINPSGGFATCHGPKLVTGSYPNPEGVSGIAMSTNPDADFGGRPFAVWGINPDDGWGNTNTLTRIDGFLLPPMTGLRYKHFFHVGNWSDAMAFERPVQNDDHPIPPVLTATSDGGFASDLSWQAAQGMTGASYDVYRGATVGSLQKIATTSLLSWRDSTPPSNATSVYRVVATGTDGVTAASNIDIVTAMTFAQAIIAYSTRVSAQPLNELRQGVDYVRTAAGLPTNTWSETIASGGGVNAAHIVELREKLGEAIDRLGLEPPSYPADPATGFVIRASDILGLRTNVLH